MEAYKTLLALRKKARQKEEKENQEQSSGKMVTQKKTEPEFFSEEAKKFLHTLLIKEPIEQKGYIGEGQFCRINEAIWQRKGDHQTVAIKSPHYSRPSSHSTLANEAKVLQKITSPYVIKLYGTIKASDSQHRLYFKLALEFCPGGTLEDKLEEISKTDISYRLKITRQICKGVQAIHEAGFIHFDLKPDNILFGADDAIRICDFGGALGETNSPHLKDSNISIIRTPNYSPPEILALEGLLSLGYQVSITNRVDIYALGIIMNQLNTGKEPFSRALGQGKHRRFFIKIQTESELLDAVLNKSARDRISDEVPKGLESLIERAWSQRSTNRPSAKDIVEELDKVIDEVGKERTLSK